jgi:transcriptional regulator with XRE-family HTH domain
MEMRTAIRLSREAAGLTQTEVTRKARLGPLALSLYERGHRELSADELARVEQVIKRDRKTPQLGKLSDLLDPNKVWDLLTPPEQRKHSRREAGLSQRNLAQAIGVAQSKISAWENGHENVLSKEKRDRLEAILGLKEGSMKEERSLSEKMDALKEKIEQTVPDTEASREIYELYESIYHDPRLQLEAASEAGKEMFRTNTELRRRIVLLEEQIATHKQLRTSLEEQRNNLEEQLANCKETRKILEEKSDSNR